MNDRQSDTTADGDPDGNLDTSRDRDHDTSRDNPDRDLDTRREDPNRDPNTSRETTDRGTRNTDALKWVSALVALVGLWIVASPFVFEATDAAYWNNTLVGTGIFLLAGYNFYRLSKDRLANVGVSALALLLGLWIVVAPFVMVMGSDTLANSTLVSGLVVTVLSAYNVYSNRKADAPEDTRSRTRA